AATGITLGLAFPFAYWLSRYVRPSLQKPLLVLVIVPFWTSYLLRMYSWLTILGSQGVVNRGPPWAGNPPRPVSLPLRPPAVVGVLVFLFFPFAVLTLYSSIDRFDWD